MSISIIICTHNRAAELRKTLAAIGRCRRPVGTSVETLVIANNCSDATVALCEAAGVRVIEVPERGLSRARNAGIAESVGEALLWLDDDVTASPDLLVAYDQALASYPESDFFGGPIRPILMGQPPAWAPAAMEVLPAVWSALDLGVEDRMFRVLEANEHPFGANMLIRRRALSFGFREDLGRNGTELLISDEEAILFQSLAARAHRGQWVANAVVEHRIAHDRQTLGYFARWCYGKAYGEVLAQKPATFPSATARAYHDVRIAYKAVSFATKWLSEGPDQWLVSLSHLNALLGQRAARNDLRRRQSRRSGPS